MGRRKKVKLPEEMIEEMALRLPPRSVGRFRCASKTLRSRLSSPAFVRAHSKFHIHTAPVRIIFEYPLEDYSDYKKLARQELRNMGEYEPRDSDSSDDSRDDWDRPPRGRHLLTFPAGGGFGKVVTSPLFQKGLVTAVAAFHGLVVVEIEIDGETNMFLFNPLTKEAIKIPPFQSKCHHSLGLGYDSLNDDYKIVQLSPKQDATFVDVYSFKAKSWRKLGKSPFNLELPPHPYNIKISPPAPCTGVFLNGRFHWLVRDSEGSSRYVIAAFNLAKEEFEQVPSPPEGSESDDSCEEDCCDDSCEIFIGFDDSSQVIDFGGCLAVVCTPWEDWIVDRINVWVMNEYGVQESWNKLVIDTRKFDGVGNFVCLLREGEVIFRQFGGDNKQFAAYCLSTGVWRDVVVDGDKEEYECLRTSDYSGVRAFTECLLSPNHMLD